MKKIKLFYGILIGLMIFSSCSSNEGSDEESNPESISIVGIWKPVKEIDVCSTGNEETSIFSTCLQMTRLTFNLNGTLNNQEYSENTGDCVENFGEGNWSLTGGNLSITISGETNNPTFFELTNNSLKIGYYDSDPDNPCDGGSLPSHYYTEYLKME